MIESVGYINLDKMWENNRVRKIGAFNRELLTTMLESLQDEEIEIVAAEHIAGGYGICVRPLWSEKDEWVACCPLEIISEEV